MKQLLFFTALFLFLQTSSSAQDTSQQNQTILNVYGFIRLVAIFDHTDMNKSDLFRPSSIPVEGPRQQNLFFTPKQSRIGLKVQRYSKLGTITAVMEGDFRQTSTPDKARLRLRHAYFKFRGITFGQAWTTFYDLKALPLMINFGGTNCATLMFRPLIRYDWQQRQNTWTIAFEKPLTTSSPVIDQRPALFPDIILAYKKNWPDGHSFIKASLLLRQTPCAIPNKENLAFTKNLYGWGWTIVGKQQIGHTDNLKYQWVAGQGISCYVRDFRGLGYEALWNETSQAIELPKLIGGYLAYQHFWADQFHSTAVIGGVKVEQNDCLKPEDFQQGMYTSINFFYQPIKDLVFGIEYLYGNRESSNHESTDASRLLARAQFDF